MTLLRRAPREVYRVYSEDQFFAGHAGEGILAPETPGAERRLPRLAGGAMLLAALGAVGGLVAITSVSSATRAGRRRGSGLLAAAAAASRGSSPLAGSHVWRQPAAVLGSAGGGPSIRRALPASTPPASPPRPAGSPLRAGALPRADEAAARQRTVVAAATRPKGPVGGQSEFGFEHKGPQ